MEVAVFFYTLGGTAVAVGILWLLLGFVESLLRK
jgi:hypothetical protein